jgi:hypothetical protein
MIDMKTVTFAIILFVLFMFGSNDDGVFAQEHVITATELAVESEVVVVGQVISIRSEWGGDRSYIFSEVTIDVEEFVKGEQNGRIITLRHLGGEVDEVGELYSHTARFLPQEEVLVFLKRDPRGVFQVAKGEHGKFSITRDQNTGRRMVEEGKSLENITRDIKMLLKE